MSYSTPLASAVICGMVGGVVAITLRPKLPSTPKARFVTEHTVPLLVSGGIMGGIYKIIPREYLRPPIGAIGVAMCLSALTDVGIEIYQHSSNKV